MAYLSLGGYEDEFVSAVEDDWQCPICHLPLKEAVQTGECGHRFCRQCLEEHFIRLEFDRQPLTCPVDRNILTRDKDMFPDKAANRKILSFIIKCPNKGCVWTGELRSKEDHLASSPLKIVVCTNANCCVRLTRNKLQEHLTVTCGWRILCCKYCKGPHPACKTKRHLTKCKRFRLKCPQRCGTRVARGEISAHIEKDCPLTIVTCQYAQMGCTAKTERKDADSHLQDAMRLHLDLTCAEFNNTREELKETQMKLNRTEEELHHTQEEFKETKRQLEEKIKHGQMQFPEEYTWKIRGFSELLRKAKTGEKPIIRSAPFYHYGYKFRLRLDLNGNGSGTDTHLSLFFQIMKGECDAKLQWPFHRRLTFSLIDQQEDACDRQNIDFPFETGNLIYKESFERPLTEVNIEGGFSQFVSHTKLRERCYSLNDTIVILLKVAPPQQL